MHTAEEQLDQLMNQTDIGLNELAAIVEHIESSGNLEAEVLERHGELVEQLTGVNELVQAWHASLSDHSGNHDVARLLQRANELEQVFTLRGTAIFERLEQCMQRLME